MQWRCPSVCLFVCSFVCYLQCVLLLVVGAYHVGHSGHTDLLFDNDVQLKLTLAANIIASVAFIPVVVLTGQLSSAIAAPELLDPFFWVFLLVTGVLGCLMAWVSAMQINVTSPVTHHISSNSKAVAQTIIAVVYYHETKRTLWWISVLMVVCGALSYAVVRMREESNKHQNDDSKHPPNQTSNHSSSKPPEVETDDQSQV